jgi:UDP-N-acetylmuramoyl-L-alanyl-D-glutamate--2,6-diaminopimelate ligase
MWQKCKNIYHLTKAVVACQIYQNPAKKLKIIGITGTDGKTTTANMLYHVLSESGKKVSMISTLSAVINGKEYDTGFHVSTPDAIALQKYLRKAVDEGTEYMVLEVTSHGLDQNRAYGIDFLVGIITNITHEHLDYHKTYAEYIKAKVKLLRNSRTLVVNRDDESYDHIIRYKAKLADKKWVTYGMSKNATINPAAFPFDLHLPGEYNKYNALAVIAACRELGIPTSDITKNLATFKSPKGRYDIVYDGKFEIVIDFAHTPNAIEQLLSSQKKKKGRIIHVFGSAGRRDVSKRPLMGEASAKYADIMILTAEDPRDEKVKDICEEIASGILTVRYFNKEHLYIIPDRQKAIDKAVEVAKDGDLILITGKGHEVTMNMGHGEEQWTDYEAVKKALAKIKL